MVMLFSKFLSIRYSIGILLKEIHKELQLDDAEDGDLIYKVT
ncbi:hypothetical protein [Lysinibacillus xylanilyticus]